MSIGHVSAVLAAPTALRPNHRMVAIVYAESANRDDNIVCLGIATVAACSGYSQRQAQVLTRDLRTLGVLIEVPFDDMPVTAVARLRKIPKHRRPRSYVFDMEALSGVQSLHPMSGVQPRVERGAATRTNGVKLAAPKPEEEPEEEPLPTATPWHETVRYEPGFEWDPTGVPHIWRGPDGKKHDVLWDAVADECRVDDTSMTRTSTTYVAKHVHELRDAGADPVEVRRRARAYRKVMPQAELTPSALCKWWPRLATIVATDDARNLPTCPPHLVMDMDDDARGMYCPRCQTWSNERNAGDNDDDG